MDGIRRLYRQENLMSSAFRSVADPSVALERFIGPLTTVGVLYASRELGCDADTPRLQEIVSNVVFAIVTGHPRTDATINPDTGSGFDDDFVKRVARIALSTVAVHLLRWEPYLEPSTRLAARRIEQLVNA